MFPAPPPARPPAPRLVLDLRELAAHEARPVPVREASERVGHVTGVQAPGGHLVEQGLEGAVDVAVQQRDPQARPRQPPDRREPREPHADDDNPRRAGDRRALRLSPKPAHSASILAAPTHAAQDGTRLTAPAGGPRGGLTSLLGALPTGWRPERSSA